MAAIAADEDAGAAPARRLATRRRFAAEIPPDAKVSTTASLNPHLSHRQYLYRYPVINDAEYVMLDVNESVNTHPTDFRVAYDDLTRNQHFNPIDAADGYVLLKRNAPQKALSAEFFTAFRANGQKPQHPTTVDFGDLIRLVGYDVLTDQYGRVSVQFYWQRLKAMDKNYYLYPFFADAAGQPRVDITFPLTVIYWYPTSMWQPDEVIMSRTVPQDEWVSLAKNHRGLVLRASIPATFAYDPELSPERLKRARTGFVTYRGERKAENLRVATLQLLNSDRISIQRFGDELDEYRGDGLRFDGVPVSAGIRLSDRDVAGARTVLAGARRQPLCEADRRGDGTRFPHGAHARFHA